MKRNRSVAVALFAVFAAASLVASCTPVTKSFELHTAEISCEEANRYVFDSVKDMQMTVTEFRAAKPGRPGFLAAEGNNRKGTVTISCESDGVHVDPRQTGGQAMAFERGLFLSMTGRGGLVVDQGKIVGRRPVGGASGTVAASASAGPSGSSALPASAGRVGAPSSSAGVQVTVEPQQGFATVLDFDADVSAAGILPIKITLTNAGSRPYDFDPEEVNVRVRGSRQRAEPLGIDGATSRLQAAAGSGIGDVSTATRIMQQNRLKAGRLDPGATISGYLFFPTGDYDRAKLLMTDVKTGEAEGFLVEF